ncbi:hypothetical protein HYPSUDRAFT_230030 [Hypholoma sublateritium FD-334 SS-4]|uniref:NADAR domain-containing protein n=1 Tax=Hypholoma sublateritium (strain FD-334 SS-4) TaxID=945553 RepID=A0A0D2N006_HYPSF|nr:hypothetical protein HYPSUDRAFT_230030 [Hypholoma sublateritium FD-334 SS-4]
MIVPSTSPRPDIPPLDTAQGSRDADDLLRVIHELASNLTNLQLTHTESERKFEQQISTLLQRVDALEAKVAVLEHDAQTTPGTGNSMPTPAGSPPAVRFDQDSPQYAGFMNHSPHRVVYRNLTYPTAAHLFEAFKFIDNHPAIAENIRACPDLHALYAVANQNSTFVRPDWPHMHLEFMEQALFLKFQQHKDLRRKLVGTEDAHIIYADTNDAFWGNGPNEMGQNLLGQALVNVRETLHVEELSMRTE